MKFDELLFTNLGEFGRYQKIQFVLVCLPIIFVSMHALSWTFSAASVPHRCRLPSEGLNVSYWTQSDLLTTATNCTEKTKRCRYRECELRNESTCRRGYIYDLSEIKYSAINRWNIVCEWSVLKAFIQSTYYIGQMGGSLVFGFLGDRIGRKKVFFIAIIMLVISGVLMAVVPYWTAFALLRAAVGFSHPGIFVIAVVIGMELVGPSKRKAASVISGIFFSLGSFLKAHDGLWHNVKKWWDQIDFPEITAENRASRRKYNYLDLVRTPRIRLRTFACLFLWPVRFISEVFRHKVVSMIYYGVSMKTDFLGGDFYGTFISGGIAEIPALLLLFALIDRIGRKPLFAGGYFLAALCMLSNLLLPSEVAKASITGCYVVIYTVTPELYPTVIRNSAMGCCSMVARVERFGTWAMIVPFGSLSLVAGFIVIFCIPETMGKPLPETIEEIEDHFHPANEEMNYPLFVIFVAFLIVQLKLYENRHCYKENQEGFFEILSSERNCNQCHGQQYCIVRTSQTEKPLMLPCLTNTMSA
ncbi:unnamed protein product [Litomosoides sigmodontis]|uniref:Major facilitator superfamily (MFS) profile domain-containing protein n=1 Tax=Litomosoides sigmodontis TaxID=42156 RepID=A0A3P6TKA5_LITSI|nr:unnamed protein product [Litomosoides sigmodontis]